MTTLCERWKSIYYNFENYDYDNKEELSNLFDEVSQYFIIPVLGTIEWRSEYIEKSLVNVEDIYKKYHHGEKISYTDENEISKNLEEMINSFGEIQGLDLYKEILLNDNPKETEKYSLNFMEQMIENYDKRHIDTHITQLEEFYKQGLLTLNTIIEWNDPSVIETFLTDLYKENIIQLNDVKKFVKNGNLPFEYIKQLVWEENINYEERLKLLEEGWIPEEEIFELYSKALIY